jgi:hypothetical protein
LTISSSWARRICAESCDPMLAITTTLEHIGHWTKMRQSLARFSGPESSPQTRSLADSIATTSGFRFSVHTTAGWSEIVSLTAGPMFSSIAARPQARRHAVEESSGFACAKGLSYTWLYDVRVLENPVSISTLPTPTDRSWCRPGGNFGPRNLREKRPESFRAKRPCSPCLRRWLFAGRGTALGSQSV